MVDTESTAVFAPLPLPVPVPVASTPAPVASTPAPVAPSPASAGAAEPPPVEAEVIEALPPGPPGEPPEGRNRWPWIAAGVLLALAALGVFLGLVVFSKNQVHVPGVVGQTLDSARVELDRAGLNVDVRRRADPAPANIVFDQAPNPGQKVDDGSSVAVFVSNGPGTVKVPDVVGLTEADAKRRIRDANLRPQVEQESSAKVALGIVIRSDPSARRPVDRRSAVTLVVSSGPQKVDVPDVTGLDQQDAVNQLREAGLSTVVREKSSSDPVDTVVSQSPAGGQQIDQGSTVTLFVSNGKVKEVPDVTGLSKAEAETEITDSGFTPSVRTRATDQPDEDGTVLSQSPSGGSKRKENATVTITVGKLTTPPPAPSP